VVGGVVLFVWRMLEDYFKRRDRDELIDAVRDELAKVKRDIIAEVRSRK
jgi:hypothetical protein